MAIGAIPLKQDAFLLPLSNCFYRSLLLISSGSGKMHASSGMQIGRRVHMATASIVRRDQEIQTDVLAELRWDHSVHANEIGVAVKDCVVTLTRKVDSY